MAGVEATTVVGRDGTLRQEEKESEDICPQEASDARSTTAPPSGRYAPRERSRRCQPLCLMNVETNDETVRDKLAGERGVM